MSKKDTSKGSDKSYSNFPQYVEIVHTLPSIVHGHVAAIAVYDGRAMLIHKQAEVCSYRELGFAFTTVTYGTCKGQRSYTQKFFSYDLRLAEVGFIQLAMGLTIGNPIELSALLAFLTSSEVTTRVGKVERAMSLISKPGIPERRINRNGKRLQGDVQHAFRHHWRFPGHSHSQYVAELTNAVGSTLFSRQTYPTGIVPYVG